MEDREFQAPMPESIRSSAQGAVALRQMTRTPAHFALSAAIGVPSSAFIGVSRLTPRVARQAAARIKRRKSQ
jgi:hypothetical protein